VNLLRPEFVIPGVRREFDDRELAATCRSSISHRRNEAWRQLVERHAPRIHGLAWAFTRSTSEADDLTQEVFLRLWQNLDRYDGRSPLSAWILAVSRNLCIDHLRRNRRDPTHAGVETEILDRIPAPGDPLADALGSDRRRVLRSALHQLPVELAEVIVLRDLLEYSYQEIASITQIPIGTVKSRLNRARPALAEVLLGGPLEPRTPTQASSRDSYREVN